ncbi:hypothetical protein AcW1_007423 [Taiwanofungus camphoratus]|nr:hypothetical protein AcW1_007423 [Antrodia cinnamomea]
MIFGCCLRPWVSFLFDRPLTDLIALGDSKATSIPIRNALDRIRLQLSGPLAVSPSRRSRVSGVFTRRPPSCALWYSDGSLFP